jgi:transposase
LVWREGATLPRVVSEDESAILDLLVTEREGALAEVTRLRSQIHQLLLQIDPEYAAKLPGLKTRKGLARLLTYDNTETPLKQQRAAAVRRTAHRLQLALHHTEEIAKQLEARTQAAGFSPLTHLCGINLLTAAALAGILGPGQRFASDAELAAYAGAAPLEASSAGAVRHRLNRGGNRRLNAILHRIAVTQARHPTEGRAYLDRRRSEGKTTREAMRALKRFLIRRIWRLWQECPTTPLAESVPVAA